MKDSWRKHFIGIAKLAADKSKDPSTQVGCVIVGIHNEIRSTGYNGMARGVLDSPERYAHRDTKLAMIVHAEANAVANAARCGTSLYACKAIITMPPCPQCAALLIQSGIGAICYPPLDPDSRWYEKQLLAETMLNEARIPISYFHDDD